MCFPLLWQLNRQLYLSISSFVKLMNWFTLGVPLAVLMLNQASRNATCGRHCITPDQPGLQAVASTRLASLKVPNATMQHSFPQVKTNRIASCHSPSHLWPAFLVSFGAFTSVHLFNAQIPQGPPHLSLHNPFCLHTLTPNDPGLNGHDFPVYISSPNLLLSVHMTFLFFFLNISTWMLRKHLSAKSKM